MIFVIGGAFSGKGEFVKNTFSAEAVPWDASRAELRIAAAVRDFHLRVRRLFDEGADIAAETDRLLAENPDIIIISNELGCGIVPADREDRAYREACGREHCRLCEAADSVYRVVCGIGVKIK